MRLSVKSQSGVLFVCSRCADRPRLRARLRVDASLLPLSWHSFCPAALPSPRTGEERRDRKNAHPRRMRSTRGSSLAKSFVGWRRVRAGQSPGQPSIRGTPATAPPPFTLYAPSVLDANSRESTHRTNGALAGHPAAERRLSPTPSPRRSRRSSPSWGLRCGLGHVVPHTAAACRA